MSLQDGSIHPTHSETAQRNQTAALNRNHSGPVFQHANPSCNERAHPYSNPSWPLRFAKIPPVDPFDPIRTARNCFKTWQVIAPLTYEMPEKPLNSSQPAAHGRIWSSRCWPICCALDYESRQIPGQCCVLLPTSRSSSIQLKFHMRCTSEESIGLNCISEKTLAAADGHVHASLKVFRGPAPCHHKEIQPCLPKSQHITDHA